MEDTIEFLQRYDIDVIRQGTSNRYTVIWPKGDVAMLYSDEVSELAVDIANACPWSGQTVEQYQRWFFDLNRNDTIRLLY
jgi:hypothetical protein